MSKCIIPSTVAISLRPEPKVAKLPIEVAVVTANLCAYSKRGPFVARE